MTRHESDTVSALAMSTTAIAIVDEAPTENSDSRIPARRWANDPVEPEPRPVVNVSSRDGAPVPKVAGADTLRRACEQWHWRTRLTYARANVPVHRYLNGKLARPAHMLESVVVRYERSSQSGYAVWWNASDRPGGYRFESACIGLESYGYKAILAAVTT